jgi:hypothetical protein
MKNRGIETPVATDGEMDIALAALPRLRADVRPDTESPPPNALACL